MKFKHEVKKEEIVHKKYDHYTMKVMGYDVFFEYSEEEGARLSLYGSRQRGHVGLVSCRPATLAELESFAFDAYEVLTAVVAAIKETGITDLRSRWDKQNDELAAMFSKTKV